MRVELNMIYLVCFSVALLLLLYIMTYGRIIDYNLMLLTVVVAVSNGGYYALSVAKTLPEAILANTISYVLGIFSPMLVFFIVCGVCKIQLPNPVIAIITFIQILIYSSVCTVGRLDIFYTSVQMHLTETGTYLTKTYGPMHTVYLISLAFYTLANIAVAVYSIRRRTAVSRINVDILLFVDLFSIGVYANERMVKTPIELMPVASTVTLVIMLIPLVKVAIFSPYNNVEIVDTEFNNKGYLVFSKQLKFMGCSEYAKTLFPEITEWEIEKEIPGNGGRFNTYIKPDFIEFVKDADKLDKSSVRVYKYNDNVFGYEIGKIRRGPSLMGYYIRVMDVTDVKVEDFGILKKVN